MATENGTTADETLTGTSGDDVINERTTPRAGSDTVLGLGGDDVIYAGTESGDSGQILSVQGGAGLDAIHYDIDNVTGFASVTLDGGADDDKFYLNRDDTNANVPTGTISVIGGSGHDIAYLNDLTLLPSLSFSGLEGLVITDPQAVSGYVSLSTEQINGVGGSISISGAQLNPYNNVRVSDGGTFDLSNSTIPYLRLDLASEDTTVTGTSGNDFIVTPASTAQYVIHGGAGNDMLYDGTSYYDGAQHGSEVFGDGGNDHLVAYGGTDYVLDGGSGVNSLEAGLTFSNSTFSPDAAATSTGLTLADGTVIRNIQSLQLTVQGDNNVVHMGANGGQLKLIGVGDVIYGGTGSDTIAAENVFISPGGQHNAQLSGFVHVDYSTASAAVHMASTTTAGPLDTIIKTDSAWVGGSPVNATGSLTGVNFFGNATVIGSAFADTLVGDLHAGANISVNLFGGAGNDVVTPGLFDATFDGGSGTNTLDFSNPAYGATAGSGVTIDLSVTGAQATGFGSDIFTNFENVVGSAGDDHIHGDDGVNVLTGGAGDDIVRAAGGDDVLIAGSGTDTLDGGAGNDTLNYAGLSGGFDISYASGNGTIHSEQGTDTLTSIENVRFFEGMLSSDPNSAGAQIYRLYETFFGRAPDQGGFDRWATKLGSGTSLATVATAFAGSPEFAAHYAGTTDTQFVTKLYETAFHREPDANGLRNWVSALSHGASRAGVALVFSESAEQKVHTAAAVGHGLFTQNETASAIALLYDAELGRLPDASGLNTFSQQLSHGTSLSAVAETIAQSSEFSHRYGGLTNSQYVDALYQTALDRTADAHGKAYFLAELNGGETRGEVAYEIAISAEHQTLLLSHPIDLLG